MEPHVDIDDISIFVQKEVANLNAAIIAHNWSANVSKQWSNEGYEGLMRYCLEDDGHQAAMRKAAVSHVRQEVCAKMDLFDTFQNKSLEEEERQRRIAELGENLILINFINQCRARERRIQNINRLILSNPVPSDPKKNTPG